MNEQELARREAALREKEAELARRERELEAAGQQPDSAAPGVQPGELSAGAPDDDRTGPAPGNAPKNIKEGLYDRIHIPLWLLDTIIAGCIIAFFVVVIVGTLKGRGLL